MNNLIDNTGGPPRGYGYGNRSYGTERKGTKAHAFATIGWAGFAHCDKCKATPGEPCYMVAPGRVVTNGTESMPHRARKLARWLEPYEV